MPDTEETRVLLARIEERLVSLADLVKSQGSRHDFEMSEIRNRISQIDTDMKELEQKVTRNSLAANIGKGVLWLLAGTGLTVLADQLSK